MATRYVASSRLEAHALDHACLGHCGGRRLHAGAAPHLHRTRCPGIPKRSTSLHAHQPELRAEQPYIGAQAFNASGCTPSGAPGGNIPPTLTWTGGATGFTPNPTRSYALTVVDYDAPVSGGFHHWIVYNIPGSATTLDAATLAQATQGKNDFGFIGYGGPCPPRTGQTHHYIFTLYALTDPSIDGKGKTYDQLVAAMGVQHGSHVNGATVLIGTFTNPAS